MGAAGYLIQHMGIEDRTGVVGGKAEAIVREGSWVAEGVIASTLPTDVVLGHDTNRSHCVESPFVIATGCPEVRRYVMDTTFSMSTGGDMRLGALCAWVARQPFAVCIISVAKMSSGSFPKASIRFVLPKKVEEGQLRAEIPVMDFDSLTQSMHGDAGAHSWANLVELAGKMAQEPHQVVSRFLSLPGLVENGQPSFAYAKDHTALAEGRLRPYPQVHGATDSRRMAGEEADPTCVWVALPTARLIMRLFAAGLTRGREDLFMDWVVV